MNYIKKTLKMGTKSPVSMTERYEAAMVLSGVGDAMGYKNGEWEFCNSGEKIHDELNKLGGVNKLHVRLPDWRVSDDTVMHLATGEALTTIGPSNDKEVLYACVAMKYQHSMTDMDERAPGMTSMSGVYRLKPDQPQGYRIPFNPQGGGCGAAMRAMCIGLAYPSPGDIDDLVAVSVEAGRMTHHHPTGYLGSMASALFTAYSIQGRSLNTWGVGLLETVERAKTYIKDKGVDVDENLNAMDYFIDKWTKYLTERNLTDGQTDPKFPETYGITERDAFYKSLSFKGWGGASGHDAPMIAYDALLSSGLDWRELCSRSMFHSGDSDSTGVIAACCYGAMKGFEGVKDRNYKDLEYRGRLATVGQKLYESSYKPDKQSSRDEA